MPKRNESMAPELNHLKYFFHVVREGGFTRASEKLGVAQPSVSKMVRTLEDQLGAKLLERGTRSFRLTASGRSVYGHCERIFAELDALTATLDEDAKVCRGPLDIGAAEPVASYLLPAVIARFKERHPRAVPAVLTAPAKDLFVPLADGRLEFGLFFHLPDPPAGLETRRIARLPFRLVIAKSKARDAKTRASFIGSREVDDTSVRRFPTLERMRREWPETSIEISSNNLTAHKELVLQGAGCSILPLFMVEKEIRSGALSCLLPDEKFEFDLKLVTRRNGVPSKAARLFLEDLKASL
jgi:DNA-binding transcriptional LysR family regulator